jgi:hypothetical protein
MAKGIQLAGGYGAGGVGDALTDLLARKFAEQQYADLQGERAEAQRIAAEERTIARRRQTEQDERQRRLDAELREDKDAKQAVDLATLFPGKVVSGATMKRVPKYLHELIATPEPERLASQSISGFASTPDAPESQMSGLDRLKKAAQPRRAPEGAVTFEDHEAVGPDSHRLQMPISERMRIAQERQTAAEAKADKDRELSEKRLGETQRHNEVIETLRANAAAAGAGRRGSMTDTGQLNAIEKLNTKFQNNTRAAREVQRQYGVMEQGMTAYGKGLNKGTAEQSVVMAFNRILDPESVVREGEYDRTSQGQSLLQRMHALALKVPAGGQIAPAVLKDMVTLSRTYRDQAAAHELRERKRIERMASHFGLPRELILTDDEDDNQVDGAAGTPAGSPAGASSGAAGGSGFRIKSVRPAGR